MTEQQHEGISNQQLQIAQHPDGSVIAPPAPIVVQDQFSFIAGVQAGQSSLFSIVNTPSELKTRKVLVHEPSRVHFFSNDKSLADVEVEDTKDFIQRFDSIEEIKEFHRDLLSKPFAFKTSITATRESNGVRDLTYTSSETFVVTIFPQHPDVRGSFMEQLVQAEDVFEENQKCYFKINFHSALANWYKEKLRLRTGKKWDIHFLSLFGQDEICLTNAPLPMDFLGSVGWVLFCVFLCPLWFCSYVFYTAYGNCTSKKKSFNFDFKVALVSQCVI